MVWNAIRAAYANFIQTNFLDQLNTARQPSLYIVSSYGAAKASPFYDPPEVFLPARLIAPLA
jgi:hypothetical protein